MQAASRELTFKQRRISARTSFSFGPSEFTYGMRDRNSERQFAADYVSIAAERQRIKRGDRSGIGLSILILLIGFGIVAADVQLGRLTPWSALWALPGVLLTGFVLTRKVRFTVVKVAGGSMLIIEDRRLPKILAELEARRRARVAELYGPLNLANDPGLEIRKIEWLAGQSILTREQADHQIAQIHDAHAPKPAQDQLVAQESAAN